MHENQLLNYNFVFLLSEKNILVFKVLQFTGLRIKKVSFIVTVELLSKKRWSGLAGVAQWIEYQPVNQRVIGSIPSQGTSLGCGPGPQWGACERQPHIDTFLPLFLPLFPSV